MLSVQLYLFLANPSCTKKKLLFFCQYKLNSKTVQVFSLISVQLKNTIQSFFDFFSLTTCFREGQSSRRHAFIKDKINSEKSKKPEVWSSFNFFFIVLSERKLVKESLYPMNLQKNLSTKRIQIYVSKIHHSKEIMISFMWRKHKNCFLEFKVNIFKFSFSVKSHRISKSFSFSVSLL